MALRRAPVKALPSLERLRELLDYDPETGSLTWKMRPCVSRKETPAAFGFNNKCAGKPAGTVHSGNSELPYLVVGIREPGAKVATYYMAHRLIWKMMTGRDPQGQVDHKDTDRLNNKWENLRDATHGQNRWNAGVSKNNTSGFKGVHRRMACTQRPWKAVLAVGRGKYRDLGYFETPEEASEAWQRAAKEQRGEFFRAAR